MHFPSPLLCHIEDNDSTDSRDIPDMNNILIKFGIDTSKLNSVPIEMYNWQMFNLKETNNSPNKQDEVDSKFSQHVTISHRIKSMTRKARVVHL